MQLSARDRTTETLKDGRPLKISEDRQESVRDLQSVYAIAWRQASASTVTIKVRLVLTGVCRCLM